MSSRIIGIESADGFFRVAESRIRGCCAQADNREVAARVANAVATPGMAGRDRHALLVRVIERCRLKPGAVEARLLGETVFRVRGRVFVFLGRTPRAAVTVKPRPEEAERVLHRPDVRRARYIGRFGWLTVAVLDEESLRLALSLMDDSYLVAAAASRRRAEGD
jgi:predicted DNA-binding protein (MmcQ/YjbR family)